MVHKVVVQEPCAEAVVVKADHMFVSSIELLDQVVADIEQAMAECGRDVVFGNVPDQLDERGVPADGKQNFLGL